VASLARMANDYERARSLLRECLLLFRHLGNEAGVEACRQGLAAVAQALGEPQLTYRDILSPRERQVAELVARGLSNADIARVLHIADGTARRHVSNILARLDFHSRAQIAGWFARCR
jgi:DNA-binding NarL/FixJ family response regulator